MRAPVTVWLLMLALLSGGAVMILEVAAPRLAAPHVGTSALVWTVVIATFLAGIALGNAWGGRLADRSRRFTLPVLFLLAAAVTALTLVLTDAAMGLTRAGSLELRVLLGVPLAFLPVAIVLGTLPPVIARELLRRGENPGWRLGAVSAAGALGSVGGTLAAGFGLVPAFGLRSIFLVVAAGLVALASLSLLARGGVVRRVGPERAPSRLAPGSIGLAVLAGAVLLTLEIVAGRLAADALGNSIYTWTSVIGVVLLGLAIGAALGGHLADRHDPKPLLRRLLLGASAASLLLLWTPAVMALSDTLAKEGWNWAGTTLLLSLAAFLVPSIVLGTISPVVIRAALRDPAVDGRIVGGLYAWGTVGAVVGTVLAGYVLIPWLELERLVLVVAFALAAASGLVRGRQPYAWMVLLVLVALAMHAPWETAKEVGDALRLRERSPSVARTDSRYSRIRVRDKPERWVRLEEEPDDDALDRIPLQPGNRWAWKEGASRFSWTGPMSIPQMARLRLAVRTPNDRRAIERLRVLTHHDHRYLSLDRLIHGFVDLQDPTWLGYGYERIYSAVIGHHWPAKDDIRCLFIGGGAYAFQRRLLALHGPGLHLITAEIDPAVTRTAYESLGLAADVRHGIVHEDARTYVAGLRPEDGGFDFVFGDAFNDVAVPFHLTTQEFARALKARMTPEGIYLVNVIEIYESGRFVGALLKTLRSVFRHVALLSAVPRLDDSRDTFVVVASDAPLRLVDLPSTGEEGVTAILYDAMEMTELEERAGHLVLTDDHAPVEILLAPVTSDRTD